VKPTYIIEILLIAIIYYPILQFVRGTRGAGVLKGLGFAALSGGFIVLIVGDVFGLDRLSALAKTFLQFGIIGFLIIFQPEIRRGLIRLGENRFLRLFERSKTSTANEVINATLRLSASRVGAIIAVERDVGLRAVAETGVPLDAEVSSALIMTTFWPGSPLHDKGMVIQHNRIVAASCVFPLTESPDLSTELGTRHRAAIGLSEESDALVLVVSEETGTISVALNGKLYRNLDRKRLLKLFAAVGRGEEQISLEMGAEGE
jgi:diadenylate cyclase